MKTSAEGKVVEIVSMAAFYKEFLPELQEDEFRARSLDDIEECGTGLAPIIIERLRKKMPMNARRRRTSANRPTRPSR